MLISPSSVHVWLQSGKFYELFQKDIFQETKYQENWQDGHQALKTFI